MQEVLARLEELLQSRYPEFLAEFYPGATVAELAEFERALGFEVDERFKALYAWRNGHKEYATRHFQNFHDLAPLATILKIYTNCTDLLDEPPDISFGMRDGWHNRWVPFLEFNRGSSSICLDMAGCFAGRVGQLVLYVYNNKCRPIVAPNIERWLEFYCELLEQDRLDEDGQMKDSLEEIWMQGMFGYPFPSEATPYPEPDYEY